MEPPDRLERHIRFGCGAMFGCVVAALTLARAERWLGLWAYVLAGLLILGCGYAARKDGDEFFWESWGKGWFWRWW